MKFVFKFQNILDFKIHREDLSRRKLAEWTCKYNGFLLSMDKIKESQRFIRQLIISSHQTIGSLGEELRTLNQSYSDLCFCIREIEKPMNQAREEYLEAKKEREIFEFLKKKDQKKFLYEKKKKEQKILDEYARNSFIMQNRDPDQ